MVLHRRHALIRVRARVRVRVRVRIMVRVRVRVSRNAPSVSLRPRACVKPERPSTVSSVTARKAVWSLELATSLKTLLRRSRPEAMIRSSAENDRT